MEKEFTLDYSLGLDALTSIKIYNSQGDLIKIVADEYQLKGTYSQTVKVGDFANGAYTIVLQSGPFEETQKLMIVR
jgi:hypothetical protein